MEIRIPAGRVAAAAGGSTIRKTPGVCGGDACIRDTRITVWGLVEWRKLGLTDDEIRERAAGIDAEDLNAAWEYYREHPEEIEQAIRRDEAA